jgi:hypothetical protein
LNGSGPPVSKVLLNFAIDSLNEMRYYLAAPQGVSGFGSLKISNWQLARPVLGFW